MIYETILDTIGNTPVVKLNRIPPKHVTIYVKIEAFNPMASVKDRLALAIINDAEEKGTIKPGQTVVEATSGNTGIALAMVCAAKGYPFVATMVETFSIERRKIMRALGAKVILTPAAERGSGMVRRAEELAKRHGWFLARQFENPANPAFHRQTTGPEILRDFAGRRLDYWVTGWGTGGTLTGAGEVLKLARQFRKRVTFEYVLISGKNDSDADADRLARLARDLGALVNILPLHPGGEDGLVPTPPARIRAFADRLRNQGVEASVRRSRGLDINAACGQLRVEVERKRRKVV